MPNQAHTMDNSYGPSNGLDPLAELDTEDLFF